MTGKVLDALLVPPGAQEDCHGDLGRCKQLGGAVHVEIGAHLVARLRSFQRFPKGPRQSVEHLVHLAGDGVVQPTT